MPKTISLQQEEDELEQVTLMNRAITKGDVAQVSEFLKKYKSLQNLENDSGYFLEKSLNIGAAANVIAFFLRAGTSKIDQKQSEKIGVFLSKCLEKCNEAPELVSLLHNRGYDFNNESTKSLLKISLRSQKIDFIKALIENGLSVDTEVEGVSLITHALIKKNVDLTKFLLQNGAKLDEKTIGTLEFQISWMLSDAGKRNDKELLKLLGKKEVDEPESKSELENGVDCLDWGSDDDDFQGLHPAGELSDDDWE